MSTTVNKYIYNKLVTKQTLQVTSDTLYFLINETD